MEHFSGIRGKLRKFTNLAGGQGVMAPILVEAVRPLPAMVIVWSEITERRNIQKRGRNAF